MWEKLIDNLWLKLGAILLACLLWFYASTDKPYEYTFRYTLELIDLSPELILAEPLPDEVEVKVYGKGRELLKLLLLENKSLKIDARDFSRGQLRLPLKKEMMDIPERLDLSVTEVISPKLLKINLQELEEKKVPIISQLSFFTEKEYFMKGEVRFIPDRIGIRGPSESVRKTKFILTRKKEFQNLNRSFSESIDLIPPLFFNLEIFPPRVDFSAEIVKGEKTRLEKLPVEIINLPMRKKSHLSPQSIDLEILGEREVLEELVPERVKVVIDAKGLNEGKVVVSPLIQLPENVILIRSEPDSFNLEIK